MLFALALLTLHYTWSDAHKRQSKAVYKDDTLGNTMSQCVMAQP